MTDDLHNKTAEYAEPEETPGILDDDTAPANPNVSTVPVIPQLSVALGLLILVFSVTYVGASRSLKEQTPTPDPIYVTEEPSVRTERAAAVSQTFDGIELEAKSAVVWDVKNQRVLFNKNADDVRPLASITKLMTALVAYELLDPEEKVRITLDALKEQGDSGLVDGEEFTVEILADLVLIESSNDGASALGTRAGGVIGTSGDPEALFVRAMNIRAGELGLTKTEFKNTTGLDLSETEAGAYGSARDVARLMDHIITSIPEAVALTTLEVTTIPNEEGEYHVAKNTNEAAGSLEGLLASKTGYTVLSGGNLVVAVNVGLNRPVVVVVMGSSYEGRFADTEKLVNRVRQAVAKSDT